MNVVLLNDSAHVNGGAAQIALSEAVGLARANHTVHLVCGNGPIGPELKDVPNLTIHCLGEFDIVEDPNRLKAALSGWWNMRAGDYVGNLLDSLHPNDTVVHLHSWARALSSSACAAAFERDFEIVLTLHDFQSACPTGNLFLHHSKSKCTLKPMSLPCIATNCDIRNYSTKLWRVGRQAVQEHFGLPRKIRHFIYFSDLARSILEPTMPRGATFHWLPNPVNVPRLPPADVSKNFPFVYMGRLVSEKGPELFARAAAAEEIPCRFIGEGASRERIRVANPNACLSGWMRRDEGLKELRSARALVFPSLWYETLGLVVLEAAGLGVPAIVPDSCAARESVLDGITGLHFRSGDETDLREKIRMLNSTSAASRMGIAAYDWFWSRPEFGIHSHLERLQTIYLSALAQRRRSPRQTASALDVEARLKAC